MIFFADFETTTMNTEYFKKNNDVRVWLWYIKSFDEKIDKMGTHIKDFVSFISKFEDGDIIYFHNLFFDGDYLMKELVNNWGWSILKDDDNVIDKSIKIFRRGKTIYYIQLFFKNKSLLIKCSYQILMSSINDLGKCINIKKLVDEINDNYDFEPIDDLDKIPQVYKDYIINDVRIALIAYKNFKSIIKEIRDDIDLTKQITIGGLTREMMKTEENKQYLTINEFTDTVADKLYRGGFTQFNPLYQKLENDVKDLKIIDVNSAYPYFLSLSLPYDLKECNCEVKRDNYHVFYLKNVRGKIKDQYKNIWIFPNPKNDDLTGKNRYVDKFQLNELWVFSRELKYFEIFYDMTYEVEKVYCMSHTPFLHNYMLKLFEFKKKFKEEKKDGFLKPIKILLNSVYGSLCLKSQYDNFVYFTRENWKPAYTKYKTTDWGRLPVGQFVFRGQSFNYNIGKYSCFRYEELSPELKHCNKLAAAWVTSMQRCKLFSTITKLSNPNEQWMYADTDSLFLSNLNKDDVEYVNSLISKELGDWDFENKNKEVGTVSIIGAKRYEVITNDFHKQKLSGVKRAINFRFFQHDNVIKNACLRPVYCKSGIALEEVDKEIIWGIQ